MTRRLLLARIAWTLPAGAIAGPDERSDALANAVRCDTVRRLAAWSKPGCDR